METTDVHTPRLLIAALTAGVMLATPAFSQEPPRVVNGPIRVSRDGRYFVEHAGKPFFWLGDTAWPLFAEYTPAQAEAYLTQPRQEGLHRRAGACWRGAAASGTEMKTPDGRTPAATSPG